ncbi:MAG TPA: TMEM175 family protein [Steroidobacteraceae bacterium]|nr:TMEM175 family protein [Steroidobacteraceae bacterium]
MSEGRRVMSSGRLEAFSDGVIAIIITIMVLELKVPRGDTVDALIPLVPVLLSYVLSFIYVGIYWNNHHHMLHATGAVTGRILWANLHLLFWLSLFPVTTAWVGENPRASAPAALYGVVLLMAAIAYWILQQCIIASQGANSILKKAVGGDWKGKVSPSLYAAGIAAAFRSPLLAQAVYLLVALLWFIPDRRIENTFIGGKP